MTLGTRLRKRIKAITTIGLLCLNCIFIEVATAQVQLPVTERRDLDSVYQETPQKLTIVLDDLACTCFRTNADSSHKLISTSPTFLKSLAAKYNVADSRLINEGILAHEYGHIKQLERNPEVLRTQPISFKEFQADFMAGFYIANKYKIKFLVNPQPSEGQIFGQICQFMQHRAANPDVYLMISMLINDDYERVISNENVSQMLYGFDAETLRLMRFASVWDGFRHSGITTFDEVYKQSSERTSRLLKVRTSDETFRALQTIGSDLILRILEGKVDYKGGIDEICTKLRNSKDLIPEPKNSIYWAILRKNRKACN